MAFGLNALVDPTIIAQRVIRDMTTGITTSELDDLATDVCAGYVSTHPDYGKLAARIFASNLHKSTPKKFSDVATILHNHIEPKTKRNAPLLSNDVYAFIMANAEELNSTIVHDLVHAMFWRFYSGKTPFSLGYGFLHIWS